MSYTPFFDFLTTSNLLSITKSNDKITPKMMNVPGIVAQKFVDQGKNFNNFIPFTTGIEIEPKAIISLNKKNKNKYNEKRPDFFIFCPKTFEEE